MPIFFYFPLIIWSGMMSLAAEDMRAQRELESVKAKARR
jgi:hypothetical protein